MTVKVSLTPGLVLSTERGADGLPVETTGRLRSREESLGTPELHVRWQDGPIGVRGVNGVQVDDVLSVCVLTLLDYNEALPHPRTTEAIQAVERALAALEARRVERVGRGVEGTMQP